MIDFTEDELREMYMVLRYGVDWNDYDRQQISQSARTKIWKELKAIENNKIKNKGGK